MARCTVHHILKTVFERARLNGQNVLFEHDSVTDAYQKGSIVKAQIDGIFAEEFCADLLVPIYEVYETEKARILDD